MVALAFGLSYLEHLLPLQMFLPLPGVKLGLANIVTLFALCYTDKSTAFAVLCCRCLLQAALFGTVSGLLFSLSGGICAYLTMSACLRGYGRFFSLFGVSMAGAAAHHIGQIGVGMIYFRSAAILSYLPGLLLLSIPMGLITGLLSRLVFERLDSIRNKK